MSQGNTLGLEWFQRQILPPNPGLHDGVFMTGYPFETFGTKHLLYIGGLVLSWILVLYLGLRHLNPKQRRRLVLFLAFFSLGQELADDLIRVIKGFGMQERTFLFTSVPWECW